MDEETIRKQAKEILDRFAGALEGVKTEEARVEREHDRRSEGKNKAEIDRKIMFSNSPRTKNGCIEAEKGGWVS